MKKEPIAFSWISSFFEDENRLESGKCRAVTVALTLATFAGFTVLNWVITGMTNNLWIGSGQSRSDLV